MKKFLFKLRDTIPAKFSFGTMFLTLYARGMMALDFFKSIADITSFSDITSNFVIMLIIWYILTIVLFVSACVVLLQMDNRFFKEKRD